MIDSLRIKCIYLCVPVSNNVTAIYRGGSSFLKRGGQIFGKRVSTERTCERGGGCRGAENFEGLALRMNVLKC